MSRKILYGLVVVAMLVMAFGVKGLGVQTAAAFVSWNDARGTVTATPLPDYNIIGIGNANAPDPLNLGGCAVAPSFGAYQGHLLTDSVAYASYLRVRIYAPNVADHVQNSWAVRVSKNGPGLAELGCALNNTSGVIDFVVAVPANTAVIVTLASNGVFVPSLTNFEGWIARSHFASGGMIVDMTADCGTITNRTVEATNIADANDGLPPVAPATEQGNGTYYLGVNFPGVLATYLDVPAGTYNLGIIDKTHNVAPVINQFAAYYPGIAVLPNLVALTPCTDSVVPLKEMTDSGVNFAHVLVTPASFGLNHDLDLGPLGVASDPAGVKNFYVNPGYLWDLGLYDNSGSIYHSLLYYNAFNPTLGTLIYHDFIGPASFFAWVDLCADSGYYDGFVTLNPDGQLNQRTFEWLNAPGGSCGAGYNGGRFLLSPAAPSSPNYVVTDLYMRESHWSYYYTPLGGSTWTLDAYDIAHPAVSATFMIGDLPFITTPLPNATSAEQYSLPLASGEVALQRGDWTDQAGDVLYKILAPDNSRRDCLTWDVISDSGGAPDSIAPCYMDATVNGTEVQLANDWLTTNLGPVTNIGRHGYWRYIQHGDLSGITNGGTDDYYQYDDYFAISSSDITMGGTWSWSWIEAMYEMGLTSGLTPTTYGPDLPVTRAEMAQFLARVMDMYGLPAGTAPAFTDVASSYWAHDAIAMLRSYGITDGCGSNMYCPEVDVTRAEMAKFIESTFRTISAYGGTVYWDTSFHVLVPGLTFIDVPSTYWANTWIEELFWDNLTSGCMRDGLTLYYCPDANVTRGEMAKFIITAIQPAVVTQGFWPILSPSK